MPCCLMHCAAACSSAARLPPVAPPPWPAAADWLRLGTAADPPEPPHPASSTAATAASATSAQRARPVVAIFIWSPSVGPVAGQEQFYAAGDDKGATTNGSRPGLPGGPALANGQVGAKPTRLGRGSGEWVRGSGRA